MAFIISGLCFCTSKIKRKFTSGVPANHSRELLLQQRSQRSHIYFYKAQQRHYHRAVSFHRSLNRKVIHASSVNHDFVCIRSTSTLIVISKFNEKVTCWIEKKGSIKLEFQKHRYYVLEMHLNSSNQNFWSKKGLNRSQYHVGSTKINDKIKFVGSVWRYIMLILHK